MSDLTPAVLIERYCPKDPVHLSSLKRIKVHGQDDNAKHAEKRGSGLTFGHDLDSRIVGTSWPRAMQC